MCDVPFVYPDMQMVYKNELTDKLSINSRYCRTNVTIRNGVTIGVKFQGGYGGAVIGDNVDIGTGAKIIGQISIGNNSIIGANAVVTKSFPSNSVIAGVPAKLLRTINELER